MFRKNLMVGLTMLVALVLLGIMIIQFGDRPARLFATPRIPVLLLGESAEGITDGSPIYYRGVNVGQVHSVGLNDDRSGVVIRAMVDQRPPLPADLEGVIHSQLIGGTASIRLVRRPATDGNGTPAGETLRANQRLPVRYHGTGLVPPEIPLLAEELRRTSEALRHSQVFERAAAAAEELEKDLRKAGPVLDSIQQIVGDVRSQQNVKEALANFAAASRSARSIGEQLEKFSSGDLARLTRQSGQVLDSTQASVQRLSQQMGERMEELSGVLKNLQAVTRKINEGGGSAGMLVNDPRLYESLAGASGELKATIADFRRLVEQWEQEGVYLKLSK